MGTLRSLFVLTISTLVASCTATTEPPLSATANNDQIVLEALADRVFVPGYDSLEQNTYALEQALIGLENAPSEARLASARLAWKIARESWEHCYACPIGEMSTGTEAAEIDPWPVAYGRIDSLLAGTTTLDTIQLHGWENDLKGFHPLEYVLFGSGGTKSANSFTTRELHYQVLLAGNLTEFAARLQSSWSTSSTDSYYSDFVTAGNGSMLYASRRDALLDVVNSIVNMCDDLANKNLELPYTTKDPSMDPSPFSGNAVSEFAARLDAARQIYEGTSTPSYGLAALLPANDSTADRQIRTGFETAIQSVLVIPSPFGTALTNAAPQIPQAVTAITNVKNILDTALLPILQKEAN